MCGDMYDCNKWLQLLQQDGDASCVKHLKRVVRTFCCGDHLPAVFPSFTMTTSLHERRTMLHLDLRWHPQYDLHDQLGTMYIHM